MKTRHDNSAYSHEHTYIFKDNTTHTHKQNVYIFQRVETAADHIIIIIMYHEQNCVSKNHVMIIYTCKSFAKYTHHKQEMVEDDKGVIRNRQSAKNRE